MLNSKFPYSIHNKVFVQQPQTCVIYAFLVQFIDGIAGTTHHVLDERRYAASFQVTTEIYWACAKGLLTSELGRVGRSPPLWDWLAACPLSPQGTLVVTPTIKSSAPTAMATCLNFTTASK